MPALQTTPIAHPEPTLVPTPVLDSAERLLAEIERLATELRGVMTAAQPSQADDLAELSNRELDVLALVADGLTNEEIAARLYLSVRTVERHLSNVYLKLRVSGKPARAAAAARYSRTRGA